METIRELLAKFKTNRSQSDSSADCELFADPFESYYYSNEEERRRPVFDLSSPSLLLYSQYMAEFDECGCNNSAEYLFHPFNYKTIECIEREACPRAVCPFFHNQMEREQARQFAATLQFQSSLDELGAEFAQMKETCEQLSKDLEAEVQQFREEKLEKQEAGEGGLKGSGG